MDGITGKELRHENRFLVLDTCGAVSQIPRFVSAGLVEVVQRSGMSIAWNELSYISAAGGQYRLCWCVGAINLGNGSSIADLCQDDQDFRTDLGEFRLIGVAPLYQDRTCVSGQSCSIDGIVGQHLSDHTRVMILDTCSMAQKPERFQNEGLLTTVTRKGISVAWPSQGITAAGGLYRLCWCHSLDLDVNTS
jgi:hypothetical protein